MSEELQAASAELDSDSTELVLRRAFELAAIEQPPVDGLDRSTLAEVAAEVGLPPSALAAALAERQLGVDLDRSMLDRLVGPARVAVQRPTTVAEDEATARLIEWLERGHGLRSRVRADGVVVASRRTDLVAKVRNTVRNASGIGGLSKVKRVSGVAVDLDDQGGAVVMVADIADKRTGALAGGAAVTAAGVAVGGVAVLVAGPVAALVIPVSAGVGVVISRLTYRGTVRKVSESIDEAVDGVVRGDTPPTVLGRVTRRVRRQVPPPTPAS